MKKYITGLLIIGVFGFLFYSKKGKSVKNIALSYVVPVNNINEAGMTVSERISLPEGFTRATYTQGSFQDYVQSYALKSFDAQIINFDGNPYVYQSGHVGILDIPVPSNGLQQCADALIRIRAEYLWDANRKSEIGFNFTSGHYCSWKKYAEGFRPKIKGNKVSFHKTAAADSSKTNFYAYLNLIYMYAGTQSLFDELPKVNTVDDLQVGDMLIYPGSPGHIIIIADVAFNSNGEKLFIFAQGNTPAQSVHILKNFNDNSLNPWYQIELDAYLEIPTYHFNKTQFVRFKNL